MPTFTLEPAAFPEGASVDAYPVSNWPNGIVNPDAAPVGTEDATATVTAGDLEFTGLTDDTEYVAYALVGGQHRYVQFSVGADTPGSTVVAGALDEGLGRKLRTDDLFTPEEYGAAGDGVTDDTQAMQDCIDAVIANGGGKIVLSAKTYLVNGDPRTDRSGYCVLSLVDPEAPTTPLSDEPSPTDSPIVFEGPVSPAMAPAQKALIKTTRTGDAYDASFGPPSVIGGATREQVGTSETSPYVSVVKFRHVRIEVPDDPDIAGLDALSFAGIETENAAIENTTASAPATNPAAFGYRGPAIFGTFLHRLRDFRVKGFYVNFAFRHFDHLELDRIYSIQSVLAIGVEDPFEGGGGRMRGGYVMASWNNNLLGAWDPVNGLKSLPAGSLYPIFDNFAMTWEQGSSPWGASATITDSNDMFRGRVAFVRHALSTQFANPGTITGGANLDIYMPGNPILSTRRKSAPADGDIGTSQMSLWLDDTSGDAKLMVKAKDSGGTVRTGQLPLSTSSAYTVTNAVSDRSFDASSYTMDELADLLGTLIEDLQAHGILG